MALASFHHIPQYANSSPPAYDPVWGYFTFGQRLTTDYGDDDRYQSSAEFVIEGHWSVDAENKLTPNLVVDDEVASDTDAMTALLARYDALEVMFNTAAQAARPDDQAEWFGPLDPRCIALPNPIRDTSGAVIYALPQRLELGESNFPLVLNYRAFLREATPPASILLIGGFPLEDAKIAILPPKPILVKHRLVSAEGAVLNCVNYTAAEVQVQGVMPHQAGEAMSEQAKEFAEKLITGRASIEACWWTPDGVQTQTLFSRVLVEQPAIQLRPSDRGTAVSFKGTIR